MHSFTVLLLFGGVASAAVDDTCSARECSDIADATSFMQAKDILEVRENVVEVKEHLPSGGSILIDNVLVETMAKDTQAVLRFQNFGKLAKSFVALAGPGDEPGILTVDEFGSPSREELRMMISNLSEAPIKEMVHQFDGVLPPEYLEELDESLMDMQHTLRETRVIYMLEHAVETMSELVHDQKFVDQMKQISKKAEALADPNANMVTRVRTMSGITALALPIFNTFVPRMNKMMDEIHLYDIEEDDVIDASEHEVVESEQTAEGTI